MSQPNRKASGLAICALMAAWLFATNLSNRIDEAESVADEASSSAMRAESRADDLERKMDEAISYRPY